MAYRAAGQLDRALPLYEEAARGIEQRRFQHEHAGGIVSNCIGALEEAEQLDRAEAWRRKWLAVVQEKAGADSLASAGELAMLSLNLLQQQKWSEAEATLRACLAIREQQQSDAWTTFNTHSLLGAALLGQQKHAAAEPLLLQGYEGMKQRAATIPPEVRAQRLTEALDRLIALYTATAQPEQATKWRNERAAVNANEPLPAK